MTELFNPRAFEGRTVFITGATGGIGRETALSFARLGAFVIGTGRSEESADRLAEALGTSGKALVLDNTDPELAKKLDAALNGLPTVDTLVNNAGIARDALCVRMKDEDWDAVIAANLTGAFRMSRYFIKSMMRQRFGRIINIASIVGCTGNPGQANYAASKAGLIGMTKTLALELGARNITVNAVAPGFVETRMTEALHEDVRAKMLSEIPLRRFGQTSDIAGAVLFLASGAASYITGATLSVNGGMFCQ